jgi:hypothetical protein
VIGADVTSLCAIGFGSKEAMARRMASGGILRMKGTGGVGIPQSGGKFCPETENAWG